MDGEGPRVGRGRTEAWTGTDGDVDGGGTEGGRDGDGLREGRGFLDKTAFNSNSVLAIIQYIRLYIHTYMSQMIKW